MCCIIKKTAASAVYQNKSRISYFGIHFIISFQYFMNILVITVKAGWVFFFIYEGTMRRCIFFLEYVVVLLKILACKREIQAASVP